MKKDRAKKVLIRLTEEEKNKLQENGRRKRDESKSLLSGGRYFKLNIKKHIK